ncbi:hypothetical protein CEP50_09130 [Actinopolyspora mortivallis]|uniref:Uncharacterized protein n=2 Tax=Actinopolyspora mortivallis TaxID=33906 RepID=A0A2T0GWY8_ACTMO|nr:hypothetical protein CEP50_09130 [Actinopolyspora mortivallis]
MFRHALGVAAAGLLLLSSGVGTSSVAEAAVDTGGEHRTSPTSVRETRTLRVSSTADSLRAPESTTPGPTTFRVDTTAEDSGWIGLARLREGASWQRFRLALKRTLSSDPSKIVEGSAELNRSAELLGGVVIHPGEPGVFTQRLRTGSYVLFDYKDVVRTSEPRHAELVVSGTARGDVPRATATLVSRTVAGVGPRFEVHGTVRAGCPVRFVNRMDQQINEAVFFPVGQDVTRERLQSFFESFGDDGEFPANPPVDPSSGLGVLPLSSDESAVFQVPLKPGRYAVLTFIKDADDGVRLGTKGQYEIIHVE